PELRRDRQARRCADARQDQSERPVAAGRRGGMSMVDVYGLARCDTCRRARAWLEAQGIAHRFVDYRDEPIAARDLLAYARQLGWEKLVNRASTTWRALTDSEKAAAS